MVQFPDGAVKAQLGVPDMKLPIQYGLSFPQRFPLTTSRIDFAQLGALTFLSPDFERFPCLSLAYEALKRGGNIACAMSSANEIAVQSFLQDRISFLQIPQLVENVMEQIPYVATPSLEDLQNTDKEARKMSMKFLTN